MTSKSPKVSISIDFLIFMIIIIRRYNPFSDQRLDHYLLVSLNEQSSYGSLRDPFVTEFFTIPMVNRTQTLAIYDLLGAKLVGVKIPASPINVCFR